MSHPTGRAARRHHKFRVRAYARRVCFDWPERVIKAEHLASCSCWMCGNPRRWFGGPMLQELRQPGVGVFAESGDRAG